VIWHRGSTGCFVLGARCVFVTSSKDTSGHILLKISAAHPSPSHLSEEKPSPDCRLNRVRSPPRRSTAPSREDVHMFSSFTRPADPPLYCCVLRPLSFGLCNAYGQFLDLLQVRPLLIRLSFYRLGVSLSCDQFSEQCLPHPPFRCLVLLFESASPPRAIF